MQFVYQLVYKMYHISKFNLRKTLSGVRIVMIAGIMLFLVNI